MTRGQSKGAADRMTAVASSTRPIAYCDILFSFCKIWLLRYHLAIFLLLFLDGTRDWSSVRGVDLALDSWCESALG